MLYKPQGFIRKKLGEKDYPLTENENILLKLKNKHKNHPCCIIGNGPSLKTCDLQRLHESGIFTFGFNKIYLAYKETDFRPTYYIIEDPIVAQNVKKKDLYSIGSKLLFFPFNYYHLFRSVPGCCFYHSHYNDFLPGYPKFGETPFHFHWGASVTYTALQFAVYMGMNPIYLIGMDFNFVTPNEADKNKSNVLISQGEQNHFHPDYRTTGEKWYIPRLKHQTHAFISAQNYCTPKDIRIFNVSRKTKLNVFIKKDINKILSITNDK